MVGETFLIKVGKVFGFTFSKGTSWIFTVVKTTGASWQIFLTILSLLILFFPAVKESYAQESLAPLGKGFGLKIVNQDESLYSLHRTLLETGGKIPMHEEIYEYESKEGKGFFSKIAVSIKNFFGNISSSIKNLFHKFGFYVTLLTTLWLYFYFWNVFYKIFKNFWNESANLRNGLVAFGVIVSIQIFTYFFFYTDGITDKVDFLIKIVPLKGLIMIWTHFVEIIKPTFVVI